MINWLQSLLRGGQKENGCGGDTTDPCNGGKQVKPVCDCNNPGGWMCHGVAGGSVAGGSVAGGSVADGSVTIT